MSLLTIPNATFFVTKKQKKKKSMIPLYIYSKERFREEDWPWAFFGHLLSPHLWLT